MQQKIDVLKKALEAKDDTRIAAAKHDLEEHMQHIGEAMAKQANVQQPTPEAGPTAPGAEGHGPKTASTDTVEDAEVIVDPE